MPKVTQEAVDSYLESLKNLRKSPNTIRSYGIGIKRFLEYFDEVSQKTIQDFVYALSKENKSPATIRPYIYGLVGLSSFMGESVDLKKINMPKLSTREAEFITVDLMKSAKQEILSVQFISGYPSKYVYGIFDALFYTGLRISELLAYKAEDVYIEDGSTYLHVIGKGDKERSIPISESVTELLLDKEFRLFLSVVSYYKICSFIKRFFGKEFTPHSFRHGYVSMLVKEGVDENSIKKVAGHSSYITTLRYFHASKTETRDAVMAAISKE